MNAVEIEEAISILADKPFDAANFPYAFLEAFGNKDTTIKRLKIGNEKLCDKIHMPVYRQQFPLTANDYLMQVDHRYRQYHGHRNTTHHP